MPDMRNEHGSRQHEKRYTINDIVRTFGISRTTVMYYEQLGIVEPGREGEQARRTYSDADVFRLMSAMLLKNVGIQPKDLPAHLEGDPFTPERCGEYARVVERDIAYRQAVLERMRLYESVAANVGAFCIRQVGRFFFVPDNAETGYRHFPADEALDKLIAHMLIASLGSCWDGIASRDLVTWGANHWGRTVPVRYAGLIEGFPTDGLAVLGGRVCACYIQRVSNLRTDEADVMRDQALACLDYAYERGFEPDGRAFCPFCLPAAENFVFPTCIPVRKRSTGA